MNSPFHKRSKSRYLYTLVPVVGTTSSSEPIPRCLQSQAIKTMLRQHKGSMVHLERQLQADTNQIPDLDVEAFASPLEVVVLFQPGPVGIQSDGAVVR
jgi:hypothetical protein